MDVFLHKDVVKKCLRTTDSLVDVYYDDILTGCSKFDINTDKRLSAFFAQIGHESANLSRVEENLNYSAERLMQVWPTRFPDRTTAELYARKPQMIANVVYANRMGNGGKETGDGWKYRGRGLIQITGKRNYERLSEYFNVDFVEEPELLLEPKWSVLSATWFWVYGASTNLNIFADREDVVTITKRINGGVHGLTDRMRRYTDCLKILLSSGGVFVRE